MRQNGPAPLAGFACRGARPVCGTAGQQMLAAAVMVRLGCLVPAASLLS
jgi:hypothetical protein